MTGQIRNCVTHQYYPYTIKVLTKKDLAKVIELYDVVLVGMEDPDMLWRYDDEMVSTFLGDDGIVAGVFVEEQLVAFRVMYFHHPGDVTNPLLCQRSSCNEETAHLALCVVHPDFRGNSLQKKMGVFLLEVAQASRTFSAMCSIVSPHNYPSISDKFSLHMVVVKLMPKFKGIWRYIFYRDMKTDPIKTSESWIFVPSHDYPEQIKLLEQGYYGVQFGKNNGETGVFFSK